MLGCFVLVNVAYRCGWVFDMVFLGSLVYDNIFL
jgi:hypothetical protein